ncbi:MAG: hypothetical protein NZ530_07910 [Thermodesulfobacteriaceae bacterium]|nr:hypothetical protein [Thermodesulfobacteriaceae bacterium]MCX8041911.1 hypothetical protein [Thermodesulfobacteriaceae bacterium]MDW8136738.1 hypothetical protein [Thermodesulfobacterium sp.]
MLQEKIEKLAQELDWEVKKLNSYLKSERKRRKRERDTFFTPQDRNLMIESVVIGGFIERAINHFIGRTLDGIFGF